MNALKHERALRDKPTRLNAPVRAGRYAYHMPSRRVVFVHFLEGNASARVCPLGPAKGGLEKILVQALIPLDREPVWR